MEWLLSPREVCVLSNVASRGRAGTVPAERHIYFMDPRQKRSGMTFLAKPESKAER